MRKGLKWLGFVVAGAGILAAAFAWVYAPLRARSLAGKYAQFRADFQSKHDAIDAQFKHQDRVVNGINWHYVDEGNPEGEVILFLHGLPEGWYSWRYVLPQVDHNYRLIAIDMKGYGRSDLQDGDYDWHTVAGQIADFMDSLGIEKYHVVSHDWGTIIGSVLVNDRPEHILGYVRMEADLLPKDSSGTLAGYIQKPQWLLFQSKFIANFMMQDPGRFIDMIYPSRMTSPFKQVDRDYLVYEFSRPGVSDQVPNYFLKKNWDLDAAIGKICKNDSPSRCCSSRPTAIPPSPSPSLPMRPWNVQMWRSNGSPIPATSATSTSLSRWPTLSTGSCVRPTDKAQRRRPSDEAYLGNVIARQHRQHHSRDEAAVLHIRRVCPCQHRA